MNMIGSLRYSPCGRKRKTTSLKPKRRSKPTFIAYKPVKTLAQQQMEEFNKKYPSYTGTGKYEPAEDQSWKKEASKNFTVASERWKCWWFDKYFWKELKIIILRKNNTSSLVGQILKSRGTDLSHEQKSVPRTPLC